MEVNGDQRAEILKQRIKDKGTLFIRRLSPKDKAPDIGILKTVHTPVPEKDQCRSKIIHRRNCVAAK